MRRGEVLSLRWADIDFVKGFIDIKESKSGPRKVPINSTVFEALRSIKQAGDYIFMNPETGTRVLDVKTAFHGACRRAGIKGVRFHDLRHTAASRMIESGVDLVTVSKILGHASIQMTMRYCHATEQNIRQAVAKLTEYMQETGKKAESVSFPHPVIDYKSRL